MKDRGHCCLILGQPDLSYSCDSSGVSQLWDRCQPATTVTSADPCSTYSTWSSSIMLALWQSSPYSTACVIQAIRNLPSEAFAARPRVLDIAKY
ncbi:hypothetical protein QQF64_001027 [Cirrhinus molitorella]|uniref:Uncharacterized protein n=1 Tax=Cirrhinus molitorella TaxID=172907 RepID=A0ABR3NYW1_9TELE